MHDISEVSRQERHRGVAAAHFALMASWDGGCFRCDFLRSGVQLFQGRWLLLPISELAEGKWKVLEERAVAVPNTN